MEVVSCQELLRPELKGKSKKRKRQREDGNEKLVKKRLQTKA